MRLNGERFNRPNLERWSRSWKWKGSLTVASGEPLEAAFLHDCPESSAIKQCSWRREARAQSSRCLFRTPGHPAMSESSTSRLPKRMYVAWTVSHVLTKPQVRPNCYGTSSPGKSFGFRNLRAG